MKTLYIDVYFLINFTVNLLALYYGAKLVKIRSSIIRLLACAVIGAAYAVADIFIDNGIIKSVGAAVALSLMCILISSGISAARRIKFGFFFVLCEVILGGLVYFGYSLLDRFAGKYISEELSGGENRSALILSVLILFSIGVLKLVIMLFNNLGGEKNVRIKIEIDGKEIKTDAFLDNGNMVRDPMNMCPVMFVKESLAEKILPRNVIELSDIDSLSGEYKKRIRLIPVTRMGQTHVMTGVKADRVSLIIDGREEPVDFTLAIDKEGGTFAGYEALAPYGALNNVI